MKIDAIRDRSKQRLNIRALWAAEFFEALRNAKFEHREHSSRCVHCEARMGLLRPGFLNEICDSATIYEMLGWKFKRDVLRRWLDDPDENLDRVQFATFGDIQPFPSSE